MASILGRIAVVLGLDSVAFEQGLGKASKQANASAREIQNSFKQFGKTWDDLLGPLEQLGGTFSNTIGTMGTQMGAAIRAIGPMSAGLGGLGVAAGVAGGGLTILGAAAAALAISGAETVEQIEHLSQKTGISRQELVAWGAVAQANGTNLETFETGVKRLEVAMSGITPAGKVARQVLQDLGVTARDPHEALLQVANAFEKMPDGARKAAVAVAIFGRAGTDMIPTLDKGSEEITKWENIARSMGPDISDNAVKATNKWRDATTEVGLAYDRIKVGLVEFLTPMGKILELAAKAVAGGPRYAYTVQSGLKEIPSTSSDDAAKAAKAKQEGEQFQAQVKSAQQLYELAKARGPAEAKLAETQKLIADYLKGDQLPAQIALATKLQEQIPALQKAADLEKEARVEAERRAQAHADVMKAIGQAVRPIYTGKTPELYQRMTTTGQMVPSGGLLAEAPQIGLPSAMTEMPDLSALIGAAKPVLDLKTVMDQFNDMFDTGVQKDIDKIEDLQSQFKELAAKGGISIGQLAQVMSKLNQSMANAEFMQAADRGTVTFQQAWASTFQRIVDEGKNFSLQITDTIGKTIDGLNRDLAKLIVTSKGLDAKKLFQGMGEDFVTSALKKTEGSVLSALGLGGVGKPDGSVSRPYHVIPHGSPFAGMTAGTGGSSGGGIFGFLKGLLSFGGFFAEGGYATPGMSYMVGEEGPELFTPGTAGSVISASALRSMGPTVNYVNNIDARGADPGMELRIKAAIRDSENRSVMRAVATYSELQKRHT
jgi:hypothetical protein